MRGDRITIKTQEALQEARKLATDARHAEIAPLHLLLALTRQEDGIVVPILQRLGADPRAVAAAAQSALAAHGRVEGDIEVGPSRELVRLLDQAEAVAREFQD